MLRSGFAFVVALLILTFPAHAQAPDAKGDAVLEVEAQKLPDSFKLNMMIRSTVIAVNQANQTNNYTVLRDLGSPRFKEANSAEKLRKVFEALRKTKFDLAPVLFFTPKLLEAPRRENGMLRLTGYFDTAPQRVSFDMLFEDIKGDWLIFGINIATEPSPAVLPSASVGAVPTPPAQGKN
jgi:hypothetical protein